jgi:hypothetical protein
MAHICLIQVDLFEQQPVFCPGLLDWWHFSIKFLENKANFHNFMVKIKTFSGRVVDRLIHCHSSARRTPTMCN